MRLARWNFISTSAAPMPTSRIWSSPRSRSGPGRSSTMFRSSSAASSSSPTTVRRPKACAASRTGSNMRSWSGSASCGATPSRGSPSIRSSRSIRSRSCAGRSRRSSKACSSATSRRSSATCGPSRRSWTTRRWCVRRLRDPASPPTRCWRGRRRPRSRTDCSRIQNQPSRAVPSAEQTRASYPWCQGSDRGSHRRSRHQF